MSFYNIDSDQSNFSIGFSKNGARDFTIWAEGYANAANTISEKLEQRSHFPDYDAYPVVFNYRHAIELYLKGIIYNTIIILDFDNKKELISRLIKSHDLILLLKKFKQILLSLYPEDMSLKIAINQIELLVNEFNGIDKDSFSFRYPIDNNGKTNFPSSLLMNISSIKNECNATLEKLDTISYMVEGTRSTVQDILASIRFNDL